MGEIIETFGIDVRLLLVQAFNFGLLLLILWYFLYRPVIVMLEQRKEKIEKGVSDSEEAAEKLSEINEEKDSIINLATVEAGGIVEKSRVRGKEKEEELLKEANEKRDRILKDAELKAEEAKNRALEESKTEIARMAILGAEKVLQEKN